MKALVAGWFSFPQLGASAGDLLARDVVCRWLADASLPYDVALAPPFAGGVDWQAIDPHVYSDVVFVCGPFGNGWPIPEFLERFAGRRLIGVNLSMLDPLDAWNPFDLLLERDSSRVSRPDISLLSTAPSVPVVGVVLVHPQSEYQHGLHAAANQAIERLIGSQPMACVPIDTRLDQNATGLRTASEVESLIARMDVVITTRLHGMVLSIKNGVPPIVVDPIANGAKVLRQAHVLGWPAAFTADTVTHDLLVDAFAWALTDEATTTARACRARALDALQIIREQFSRALVERSTTVRT